MRGLATSAGLNAGTATGVPASVPPRPISITSMLSAAEAMASLMLRLPQRRVGPRPTTTIAMFWVIAYSTIASDTRPPVRIAVLAPSSPASFTTLRMCARSSIGRRCRRGVST